jgi:hypothetical protein
MKIKKLAYYIAKYDSLEVVDYIIDVLEQENVRYLSVIDGIVVIRRVLDDICSYSVAGKIMKKLLNHEVRRGRLTQEQMDKFVSVFGYSCAGCVENQVNQLDHMNPGGCLYYE